MKVLQSSVFRAFCAIVIGILLVANPGIATKWLVILIGMLFLIPGVVTLVIYMRLKFTTVASRPFFPIVGVGSILLGLLLIVFPIHFIEILMYILGAFLIVAASNQMANLWQYRKMVVVSPAYFIVPVFTFFVAGFLIIRPLEAVFTILGVMSMVYGLSEFFHAWHFRKVIPIQQKSTIVKASSKDAEVKEKQ
ncbi:MAG: DUF308 domain-containing protein [Bacteroidaceae bacterium]